MDYDELIEEGMGEHVYWKRFRDREPEYEIPDPGDLDEKIVDAGGPAPEEE